MPETVKSIGNFVFQYCKGVREFELPGSLEFIGDYAFLGCTGIQTMKLPKNLKRIGYNIFSECVNLGNIEVAKGGLTYQSTDGVLYEITGDKLTLVKYAPAKANKTFSMPKKVIAVAQYAFSDCTSLTTVAFTADVESVGEFAFQNCVALSKITLSEKLKTVGDRAFSNCKKMNSILLYGNVESIGNEVFFGCDILSSISVLDSNQNYKSLDGNLYTKDGTVLLQYAIGKSNQHFKIPEHVRIVADRAFSGCKYLTSVTFSEGTVKIGKSAFSLCKGLTNVILPGTLETIDSFAFSSCGALKTIRFNGKEIEWNAIEKGEGWNSLTGEYLLACTDGTLKK
jgi:hypothetical protein